MDSLKNISNPLHRQKKESFKIFEEAPEKTLTKLNQTKFVFFLTITVSLLFTFVIIVSNGEDSTFGFTYQSFNYAIFEIFKVPLRVLAVGLVALGFIASYHRSVQTKAQMIEAKKAIVFDQYFKHMDEFQKYCNDDGIRKVLKFNFPRKFHGQLWPDYRNGNKVQNIDTIDFISENLNIIISSLCTEPENKDLKLQYTKNIWLAIELLATKLNITFESKFLDVTKLSRSETNQVSNSVHNFYISDTIEAITECVEVLRIVLNFDYTPNDELEEIFGQFERISQLNSRAFRGKSSVSINTWIVDEHSKDSLINYK